MTTTRITTVAPILNCEFPAGILYVRATTADIDTDGSWSNRDKVVARPTLAISTNPEFKYRATVEEGALVLRKRTYRIHTGRTHLQDTPHRSPDTWHAHSSLSYNQYINDNDVPVSWDTATHAQLSALVSEACERYVAVHPGWRELSLRMAVESKLASAERNADDKREELAAIEARAGRFAAVLAKPTIIVKSINASDLRR